MKKHPINFGIEAMEVRIDFDFSDVRLSQLFLGKFLVGMASLNARNTASPGIRFKVLELLYPGGISVRRPTWRPSDQLKGESK